MGAPVLGCSVTWSLFQVRAMVGVVMVLTVMLTRTAMRFHLWSLWGRHRHHHLPPPPSPFLTRAEMLSELMATRRESVHVMELLV